MKLFFKNEKGMNMVELLTTIAITGTLATVGIKSYNSQTAKARTAEAKKSLSFIYTSEQSFKGTWNTYHENLIAIGAIPAGSYHYDIGFAKGVSINDGVTNPDGLLASYPLKESLNVKECINFNEICLGNCATQAHAKINDPLKNPYFKTNNCTVESCKDANFKCLTDYSDSSAKATATAFKALAIGQLNSPDIWSINEDKEVIHEQDGSQ